VDTRVDNAEKKNAKRILYKRTRNNDDIREKRKAQYSEGKAPYEATMKIKKLDPGKSTAT